MQIRAICALVPLPLCAIALWAAENVWKTKDSSQWTSEDVQKVLTDSPWAKTGNASVEGSGQPGGMGRGGGMGGGGMGGGMGRIGGIGFPGGGMGGPMGGGMGGGRGRGGGQSRQAPISVTVRWDSAAPVKQALGIRYKNTDNDPAKVPDASAKDYIVTVAGIPPGGGQSPNMRRRYPDDQSGNGNGSDADDDSRSRKRDPAAIREELMESGRIIRKGKADLVPEDVKVEDSGDIHFFFPRAETPIVKADKEITFQMRLGRMKVEKKFNVKEMEFQGALAI